MSHTNSTTHYALSQFISTDTPGWMSDINQDNSKIDTAIYNNATDIAQNASDISTMNSKLTNMLPDAGSTGTVLQKTAGGATWSNLFDLIYPIGSIYMTENDSFNPAASFGGTWQRIQDRFLLAAGTTYSNGDVGGEASHTLTKAEMPAHDHKLQIATGDTWYDAEIYHTFSSGNTKSGFSWNSGTHSTNSRITSTGGGSAHNNMPPYLVVMVWKRVA